MKTDKNIFLHHRLLAGVAVCCLAWVCGSGQARADMPVVDMTVDNALVGPGTSLHNDLVGSGLNLSPTPTNLLAAIAALSAQLTANTQAQTTALSSMNDTKDARAVQQKMEEARLDAMKRTAVGASACNVVTSSIAAGSAPQLVSAWTSQISQQSLDMMLGASAGYTASSKGVDAGTAQKITMHCQLSASVNDVDSGACPSQNIQPASEAAGNQAQAKAVGGDLDANTILNAPHFTLSTQDTQLANSFVAQAFNDKIMGALPKNFVKLDPNNARIFAARLSEAAQRSIALSVVGDQIAREAPTTSSSQTTSGSGGGSTSLSSWAQGMAANVLGYASSNPFPNGVSWEAYLELRSKAWFFNPTWGATVANQGADQNTKDIAMIDAWGVYMQWENLQQLEHTNFLLAAILTNLEGRDQQSKTN